MKGWNYMSEQYKSREERRKKQAQQSSKKKRIKNQKLDYGKRSL